MPKMRNPKGTGSYRTLPNGSKQFRQRIDGEERTVTAKTPKELEERKKEIVDLPIVKGKMKVDEWFEKWLKIYIEPLKKKATYNQYSIIYKVHIKPAIGKRTMSKIKSYDIQAVIAEMNQKTRKYKRKDKETGKMIEVDTGEKLSTWTMKHTRKVMNGAFEKAYKDKIIASNPVKDIEVPKKQAKPRKTLTIEELSKLFKVLEKSRWIWSARFMLATGVRRGELLALKWNDIDYINNRITIDESNSSTGLDDTKNSKIHFIPLSKKVKEYLNGQKEMLKEESNPILLNETLKKTDLIFPNEKGSMLKPGSYYTLFARAAEKAEIKASPHCLRHTFVFLNRKILSLKELQDILGHDERTTTTDMYGDMVNESTDKVASQMDEVFNQLDTDMEKFKNEKGKNNVIEFKRKVK